MIKIDNLQVIKQRYSDIYTYYKAIEDKLQLEHIRLEYARSGDPTFVLKKDDTELYLNSKYDPYKEAQSWIGQYEDSLTEYDHVLFYGCGLGYHIDYFTKLCPKTDFSVYEPDTELFFQALSTRDLEFLESKKLLDLYVEFIPGFTSASVQGFVNTIKSKVLLIIHPVYERYHKEKTQTFINAFRAAVGGKKEQLATTNEFEKLWTLNSMYNFIKVLETPNVIRDKKTLFRKKPVLLVAAGPSLEEEIENIRYIKDNGLAYIFSVGSAIKALLANGIHPHAVTSYDPVTFNVMVFEDIINNRISDIPLIFGTSVGFKTTQLYTGPLLHMITNQDPIAPYYLGEEININQEVVSDAPSIAVLTLELLYKLGCDPIILVGQNFAFKNEQYYASGIEHVFRPSKLSDNDKSRMVFTESVDGGQVETMEGHNYGRRQMEGYLTNFKDVTVYNSTKGGAKIQGTTFRFLEDIMSELLTEEVVVPDWYEGGKTKYNYEYMHEKAKAIQEEHKKMPDQIDALIKVLRKMDTLVQYNEPKQCQKEFAKLDQAFKDLTKNGFYQIYTKSMLRIQHEMLNKEIIPIRKIGDPVKRAEKVIEVFGKFITEVQNNLLQTNDFFTMLQQIILMTNDEKTTTDEKPKENAEYANQAN